MSKIKIMKTLSVETDKITKLGENDCLTTEYFSEQIGIQRNTTSQYLNELVKDNLAIKVKSRPAYFFSRLVFSQKFFEPQQAIYENFAELEHEAQQLKVKAAPDPFQRFIGAETSLKTAIDQIKSSVHYPGTGLPFMMYGETGVGKSLLAKMTHEYCTEKGILAEGAPFLALNCAQYVHNKELLSSILFGYSKGAFTGAESEHVGLLEAADGGILFLDECHRLAPESQEKLFTFIDSGEFQRLGENNHGRKSSVRLIFATTENIQENFLRTFLRRIPITIQIPNLSHRTKQEVAEFVYTFLIEESQKLNKPLTVTPWMLNRLLSLTYTDNVGELKNTITLLCANAFSKEGGQEQLLINADVLENTLLTKFLAVNEIDPVENQDILITQTSEVASFIHYAGNELVLIKGIFKVFEELFQALEMEKISETYLLQQLAREANTVIEQLVNHELDEQSQRSLNYLTSTIKELVNYVESTHFVRIKGNSVVAIANYLYRRSHFLMDLPFSTEANREAMYQFVSKKLLVETKLVNAFLELVETKLDVTLMLEEKVLLAFYLKSLNLEIQQPKMRGIILAHGFSTASSIADVVNRFLDDSIFEAFDMPFNVPLEKVKESLEKYLATQDCQEGLVILVDMGSLMVLSKALVDYSKGPILMINNVTTQQALFVGELLKKEVDIELIGEKITNGLQMTYEIAYPQLAKQPLIITVCHTGLGAAQQLKEFIQSSLPAETTYKIEAVDFNYLKKYGKENSLFKQYNVQGIVGTADPAVPEVKYVALEDLISGQGEREIDALFTEITDEKVRKEINNALVRNLSIERLVSAITILDVKKVIAYIDEVIAELERRFVLTLPNSKKAILYVHIAGLVERSIRNFQELAYPEKSYQPERFNRITIISQALQPIELAYNITISQNELNYLYDLLFDE